MIRDIIYYDVYLIIITILTVIYIARFLHNYLQDSSTHIYQKKSEYIYSALFLTIFMIIFIGFRPISAVFADMPGYAEAMNDGRYEGIGFGFFNNFIFYPMMGFLSSHGASEQTPIVILAIINFVATLIAIRKFFPKDTYLAMLVFFAAYSTFGGATNGLKAGCAAALFLVALAYKENKLTFYIFLLLSLGFHHSMILPIGATLLSLYYKKTNKYLFFWFLCLIISFLHITYFQDLFGENLADYDEHGANYLTTYATSIESGFTGKTGFRYDFILYSFIPIFIFNIIKNQKDRISDKYIFLINIYIISNAVWLLCMYANYTNRIAALSWSLYPVLIIYPFVNDIKRWSTKHDVNLSIIAFSHLSFTLFMHFIYEQV